MQALRIAERDVCESARCRFVHSWLVDGWGLGVLLWLMCLIFLGIRTLRRGHWVLFLFGIGLPIFWLFGALIPARS